MGGRTCLRGGGGGRRCSTREDRTSWGRSARTHSLHNTSTGATTHTNTAATGWGTLNFVTPALLTAEGPHSGPDHTLTTLPLSRADHTPRTHTGALVQVTRCVPSQVWCWTVAWLALPPRLAALARHATHFNLFMLLFLTMTVYHILIFMLFIVQCDGKTHVTSLYCLKPARK